MFFLNRVAGVLIAAISIFVLSTSFIETEKGYVQIKYFGEPSKPYPVIQFFLPGSIDTTYEKYPVHKFPVNQSQFDSIVMISKENIRNSAVDILPDLVEITVDKNGQREFFVTRDKNEIRKAFDRISKQFNGHDKETFIKAVLIDFQGSLGIVPISDIPRKKGGRIKKVQ